MSEKTVRAKFLELVVIRATARNHMSGKPKPIPQREGAVPRNDGPAAVVTLVCQMPNRSRMEIDIKAQVTMGGGGVSVGFSSKKKASSERRCKVSRSKSNQLVLEGVSAPQGKQLTSFAT